ncbi:AraC family transcriptional regulator [Pontibacter chitinilyticus]|uniref:AraC family transcriptional regulator n=1 Tax=Pontibacter chitinilyticus TaxID=2674989 RepID=UPI00321A4A68
MSNYTLHIRNMVCPRCIKVVTEELEQLRLPIATVQLGEAHLLRQPTEAELDQIRQALTTDGFELLDSKRTEIAEQIKIALISLIRSGKLEDLHINISDYLANTLNKDYNFLSSLFSAEEGITIARYVVLQKIERAKELLAYDELTLSQIAYQLGYSSVAHLSGQFKQVTGLTPSAYKKDTALLRKPLDQVQ